jgi:hypothetical protein
MRQIIEISQLQFNVCTAICLNYFSRVPITVLLSQRSSYCSPYLFQFMQLNIYTFILTKEFSVA